jgi:hypothetical protein
VWPFALLAVSESVQGSDGIINTSQDTSHVNGSYRFIDKRYMAQLYNFCTRLLFEFIVPEPTASWSSPARGTR